MPINYKDFTSVSHQLLTAQPCTEAGLRSSMSRAYYGLYHAALQYADTISVPPVSDTIGPVHAKLGAYYQLPTQCEKSVKLMMRQIGYSLKALHELRCKADYQLDTKIDQLEADTVYQRCLEKIDLVEKLAATKAA